MENTDETKAPCNCANASLMGTTVTSQFAQFPNTVNSIVGTGIEIPNAGLAFNMPGGSTTPRFKIDFGANTIRIEILQQPASYGAGASFTFTNLNPLLAGCPPAFIQSINVTTNKPPSAFNVVAAVTFGAHSVHVPIAPNNATIDWYPGEFILIKLNFACDVVPDEPCDCGCNGCNENADAQEVVLANKAKAKSKVVAAPSNSTICRPTPYTDYPCKSAIAVKTLNLCFYLHYGDSANDQIESDDCETVLLTVCNPYSDLTFEGLRITKLIITPTPSSGEIHIVPDSFICFDCLEPCTCKSREFCLHTCCVPPGIYNVVAEYCVDKICVNRVVKGNVSLPFPVIKD